MAVDVDHTKLASILRAVGSEPAPELSEHDDALASYIAELSAVDPDSLTPDGAKAFWINLYNAGALRLAGEAQAVGLTSVLRVPGAFSRPYFEIGGEQLSLDTVEHGKVRRFKDPRIHAALVCGSVSCPALRDEPYGAGRVEDQLEDQMRHFLDAGGARLSGTQSRLELSRIFRWYGSDFVRPERMPTLLPSSKRAVVKSLGPWATEDLEQADQIEYQSYDWGLRCSLG